MTIREQILQLVWHAIKDATDNAVKGVYYASINAKVPYRYGTHVPKDK